MLKRKIGWQKYEDVLESQINSPLLEMISSSITNNKHLESSINPAEAPYLHEDDEYDQDQDQKSHQHKLLIAIPDEISNEINLVSNFECWVGHSNFNLTNGIKNTLSCQDGVEILKVCSRYRFLIGIGKMFDFRDVRQGIEKELLGTNSNGTGEDGR
jgi:hypothetical protein